MNTQEILPATRLYTSEGLRRRTFIRGGVVGTRRSAVIVVGRCSKHDDTRDTRAKTTHETHESNQLLLGHTSQTNCYSLHSYLNICKHMRGGHDIGAHTQTRIQNKHEFIQTTRDVGIVGTWLCI